MDFDKLVRECDYYTKLAVTGWVLKHVLAHAKERGSYRGLIYERLGFGRDAYTYLYDCGGLKIFNEFDLPRADEVKRLVKERRIGALKEPLGLCQVSGCFEDGVWGSGATRTCPVHNEINDNKTESQ